MPSRVVIDRGEETMSTVYLKLLVMKVVNSIVYLAVVTTILFIEEFSMTSNLKYTVLSTSLMIQAANSKIGPAVAAG